METLLVIGAVFIVGWILFQLIESVLSTVLILICLVIALNYFHVIHINKYYDQTIGKIINQQVDEAKQGLSKLGCGDGKGFVIGEPSRCRDYKKAINQCKTIPTDSRQAACIDRVKRHYRIADTNK